jgi:hypothetical protein
VLMSGCGGPVVPPGALPTSLKEPMMGLATGVDYDRGDFRRYSPSPAGAAAVAAVAIADVGSYFA